MNWKAKLILHLMELSQQAKKAQAIFKSVWSTNSFSQFQSKYKQQKQKEYAIKSKEVFKVNSSELVCQTLQTNDLLPNFFTNELILQHYPWTETPNRSINFFKNSYVRTELALSSQPQLREKLNLLYEGTVRTGRTFQLMDSMAGIISYTHCFGGGFKTPLNQQPMLCVTGSVESLHLFDKLNIEKDLTIEGYINSVGTTSMEIQINAIQQNRLKATSLFTMVARNANNPLQGYKVPELSFQGLQQTQKDKAIQRREAARLNVINRREQMANSYDNKPPSPQEIQEIHRIFLQRKSQFSRYSKSTPISQTVVSNSHIMHTQNRNIHGKIFGGFLIREMIEIAYVAGCRYSQEHFRIENLTNIYFKRPVDIANRLTIKAMVTYVKGNRMIITVEAYTSLMTDREEKLACHLHLVGKVKTESTKVHPQSYSQALQYLSSRKVFQSLFY